MTFQEAKFHQCSLTQSIRPPDEPGGTIPLEIWDCTNGWNSSGFDSAADAIVAIGGHVGAPFDMEVGMVRSLLVNLPSEIEAPRKHLMMICIYYAITDAWSNQIILCELLKAYSAYAAGAKEPTGFPLLRLEYADYAAFQWRCLEMEEHLEHQLDYWMEHLENVPPPLNLPFDRPRSLSPSGCGGYLPVCIPGKLMVALANICEGHRCNICVGLIATFQLTLSRLAGNVVDLVLGTNYSGREKGPLQGMVGRIVESIAIRGKLKENPSFSNLVERLRLVVADAVKHSNIPFSRIIQHLEVPHIANCHPVYQVGRHLFANFVADWYVTLPTSHRLC